MSCTRKIVFAFISGGLIFFSFSLRGQEKKIIDSLQTVYDNSNQDTTRILVLVEIAKQWYRNEPDTAINVARRALVWAERISFDKGIARGYDALGLGYWMKSNHAEALSYHQKSLPYFESSNDQQGYGLCLNHIGIVYYYQADYPLALEYHHRALTILEEVQDKEGVAVVYNNLGLNSEATGDLPQALSFYEKALKIYESKGSKSGIALSLTNIGYIHFNQGDYDKALGDLGRAAKIQEQINDRSTLISSLIGMAEVYQRQKLYDQSIAAAERAYRLARSMNSLLDAKEATGVLYKTYKEQNNPVKALAYFERFKELNDSIFSVENNRVIASLEGRLALERKQKEIEGLETERALQQKVNYLVLAVLLGVIGFSFYVVRNRIKLQVAYRKLENTNAKLIDLKKEVEAQAEQLGISNKTKDKIFSIVSHDLRSPMMALKGLLHLIENDQLKIEEFKAFVPELSKRVANASDIMDELLQWSRGQLEGIEPHPVNLDVANLVYKKTEEYQEQATDKGIVLKHGQIDQSVHAWADGDMVKTVLRNLISNAIKFCRKGDSITLEAKNSGANVEISISDTGIGIKPEHLSKLFTDYGFSTMGTAQEKGTGVGLMLCKEFIEKNKGKIWVESAEGRGTQFKFNLPVKAN